MSEHEQDREAVGPRLDRGVGRQGRRRAIGDTLDTAAGIKHDPAHTTGIVRRRERSPLPGADWVADMRARLERPCCGTLHGSRHRATCPEHPLGRHCQNGGDVCLAGNADGICCPEDSCDIDDGARQTPNAKLRGAQP